MNRAYLRNARKTIRRHGVFIQGVLADSSLDAPYVYTAGFQLLDPPRPEVILFGVPAHSASALVNQVYARVRDGTAALEPGAVLSGFDGFDEAVRVRVDRVLPRWAEGYAPVAGAVLERDAVAVPFVQLVWADADGRWPDDVDAHGCLPHHQPLLAHDPAWLLPVAHTAEEDAFWGQACGDDRVALPVYGHTRPEGRYEVLAATLLDEERALIGEVPWLADYVAYGDVVAVAPVEDAETGEPVLGGAFAGVLRGGALLEEGGYRALAFDVTVRSERAVDRFLDVVCDLTADAGRARASTSPGRLHLNTRNPEEARAALRPLVRDGHLVEVGLRSGPPELPDHPIGECEARHRH